MNLSSFGDELIKLDECVNIPVPYRVSTLAPFESMKWIGAVAVSVPRRAEVNGPSGGIGISDSVGVVVL